MFADSSMYRKNHAEEICFLHSDGFFQCAWGLALCATAFGLAASLEAAATRATSAHRWYEAELRHS
jgi:hypothetical protein